MVTRSHMQGSKEDADMKNRLVDSSGRRKKVG